MYANLGCGNCGQDDDETLGIALPAIGGAISAIGSLFGGGHPEDPGRLATNQQHYAEAVAGNESALNFLKGMSGRFGTVKDNDLCVNGCSGWATATAKNDAYNKYNQAMAILKTKPASTVTPSAAGVSFGGPVMGGLATGPLLLAGAAAVAAIMLSKRGRR